MNNLKTNNLDLNIDNYKLDDILNLFNITINFDDNDLKDVKKKVLLMHPDKSGLHKDIFLFYSAAYKLLANIYNTNNEQNNRFSNNNVVEYKPYDNSLDNVNDDTKNLLNNIMKNNSKNFNKWFNTQFEKNVLSSTDDGYSDWMKSTPAEKHDEVDTLDEMHKKLSNHRKNISTLANYDGFHELSHSFGSNGTLITQKDAQYSSGIFGGNLQYDDLRKVYTETLIPVDIDNYNTSNQSIDSYISKRENQNLTPISKEEGLKQLNKEKEGMNTAYMQQNYELLKREQLSKKKNDDFLNNLKLLKNNIFK